MSTVTRQILWNVAPWSVTVLYLASALAGGWIVFWFWRRARRWQGRTETVRADWKSGVARLTGYLATHATIRRDRYAGWMHLLIFWGFVTELAATSLVAVQHHFHLVFLVGNTYLIFSLVSDIGGLALGVGLCMALWRRRPGAPDGRLQRNPAITRLLGLLLAITATGFLVEAARIATDFPPFERWSAVGYVLANALAMVGISGTRAAHLHRWLWNGHGVLAVSFFVIIPLSLMRHVVLGAYNVALPQAKPGRWNARENLRRVDWMQADACLTCGRCDEVCPAQGAGKPLSPRGVVLGLRAYLDGTTGSISESVPDGALWSCTTCHACDSACPIHINIVDKIATLRRDRVLHGKLGEAGLRQGYGGQAAVQALESTAQKHNPFSKPNSARMEWASGIDVPVAKPGEKIDLLYWVGCAGAFDPAGRQITRAMVKILNRLKISYRVLGCGERCSGDPARRLGEEGLWKELAQSNQAKFGEHAVQTILTSCPHCLNAFANEYPSVGPTPRVLHHSQWLRARLEEGTLKISTQKGESITFHDPCYLSRAGDEIEAPRAILDEFASGGRVEMRDHGKKSLCCGGGGGQLWLDVRGKTRVETVRALQVEQTGAQTVATGCPFCHVMLEAGRASLPEGQGKWRVKDIAELVEENL